MWLKTKNFLHVSICIRKAESMILVSEAFYFPFVVCSLSSISVERKRGGTHRPKSNLGTHRLSPDDDLAFYWLFFFLDLSAFICRYVFLEISHRCHISTLTFIHFLHSHASCYRTVNNDWRMEEEVVAWYSLSGYLPATPEPSTYCPLTPENRSSSDR